MFAMPMKICMTLRERKKKGSFHDDDDYNLSNVQYLNVRMVGFVDFVNYMTSEISTTVLCISNSHIVKKTKYCKTDKKNT